MSVFSTAILAYTAFVLGIITAGYSIAPDKYPLNYWELAGWLMFAATTIVFEVSNK